MGKKALSFYIKARRNVNNKNVNVQRTCRISLSGSLANFQRNEIKIPQSHTKPKAQQRNIFFFFLHISNRRRYNNSKLQPVFIVSWSVTLEIYTMFLFDLRDLYYSHFILSITIFPCARFSKRENPISGYSSWKRNDLTLSPFSHISTEKIHSLYGNDPVWSLHFHVLFSVSSISIKIKKHQ